MGIIGLPITVSITGEADTDVNSEASFPKYVLAAAPTPIQLRDNGTMNAVITTEELTFDAQKIDATPAIKKALGE